MNHSAAMNGAKVLSRALDLLRSLATDDDRRSLALHAAALDIPLSTAHRLAGVLVGNGILARVGRGQYVRSGGLADLAGRPMKHDDLKAIARNPIKQLVAETNSAGHLGVWDQDMVQYLVRIAPHGYALFTREGDRLEAYCSAIGKTLLAYMPEAEQEAYLAIGSLVELTSHTITDPIRLRDELAQIRAAGVATDRQEIADGLYCIAAPVRRRDGRVIAALSLSGSQAVDRAEQSLRRCAEIISERLG